MNDTKNIQFSKVDHVEIYTFDPSLERFRQQIIVGGGDAEGTIREILQNSLDAKNHETEGPVKVNLTITEIDRSDIPGIDEVFDHIQSLNPGNSYTSETVNHMKSKQADQSVSVLTASDSNTKGLSGAESEDGGNYAVYAYNKGVHAVHENAGTEKTRGGSHGVGKIANNAASEIHLMYFANCDENGSLHLGGSVQLFDHQIDGQAYRGTGHYVSLAERGTFIPNLNKHAHPVFQKNTRGLKIIIPYLRSELSEENSLVKAITSNFFIAILEKKLIVTLNIREKVIEITDESLSDIIENYYPNEISELKNDVLPLYVHTYLHAEPKKIQVTLPKKYGSQIFNFNLYYYDENEKIPAGRTAIVRSVGMKIEDRKVPSHVRTPYNAVLIGGPGEDEYLKSLENESHTALSNEQIRNPEKKLKAKSFLNSLNKQLKKVIEESQSDKYEIDGEIDTSDLIYDLNWEFDQQITKQSEKVELTNGINLLIDNKKEHRKKHKKGQKGNETSEITDKKRKPRKKQHAPDIEQEVVNYILPPAVVNRALINQEEFVSFSFNEIEGADQWEKVNLGMKLVNGQGEELDEGVKLTDLYTNIIETNSGESVISFDDEKMYDVPVSSGHVFLHLKTGQRYNPNLKFVYKVEVQL